MWPLKIYRIHIDESICTTERNKYMFKTRGCCCKIPIVASVAIKDTAVRVPIEILTVTHQTKKMTYRISSQLKTNVVSLSLQ